MNRNVNKYDDFILNLIVESVINKTAALYFSERFRGLLKEITHPIAKKLLDSEDMTETYKITYIDISSDGNDKISFLTIPKTLDVIRNIKGYDKDDDIYSTDIHRYNIERSDDIYSARQRSVTTIGKLINKLFSNEFPVGGEPGKDIQSFVDKFKSIRENKVIKVVKGEDIIKYYNEEQYDEKEGTLGNSCMRYNHCKYYIQFYAVNADVVSLVILTNKDSEKIRGRALVWKLSDPNGRLFMDRIYTINSYEEEYFKEYAIKNNWLYKENQNSNEYEYIVDPSSDDETERLDMIVENVKKNNTDEYPYMDTFKYFYPELNILTNDENYDEDQTYWKLEETDGTYEDANHEGMIYSDHYNEWINPESDNVNYCEWGDEYRYDEDCIWLEKYDVMATDDYVDDNLIECDYYLGSDKYRKPDDVIELYDNNGNATFEYVENGGGVYSGYLDAEILSDEAEYSEYHKTYLYRPESTEVYIDVEMDNTDWRADDDDTWFKWEYNDECYDNDISISELREYNGLEENDEETE